uniref:Lactosylceramide 4-alpha-galactosyltransferase n=1 Tax=Calidris pygmaea TaxID=425635 RepID=A0A8C3KG35_9CHAR
MLHILPIGKQKLHGPYTRTEMRISLGFLPTQSSCEQFMPPSPHAVSGGPPPPPGDSAARAHPGTRAVLLMKGLANGNASLPNLWAFSLLSCLPNWYPQLENHKGPHFLHDLSDACRIAIVWKFGSIYLDTDFIVLKNLKNLTSSLGIESRDILNRAFLSFTPKHEYMELCMQDFVDNYNGWKWAHQGPALLTRVFKKWCSISNIQNNMSCKGVRALSPEAVYPIHWGIRQKFFQSISSSELHKLLKNTYAVHVRNKLSHGTRLEVPSQAFLAQLYSQFCPATYFLQIKKLELRACYYSAYRHLGNLGPNQLSL